MILPLSWIALKFFHVTPEIVIAIYATVEILTQFVRVYIVYPRIGLDIKCFYTKILVPSLLTMLVCAIPAVLFYLFVSPTSFVAFAVEVIILLAMVGVIIFFIGLDKTEKDFLVRKLKVILRIDIGQN